MSGLLSPCILSWKIGERKVNSQGGRQSIFLRQHTLEKDWKEGSNKPVMEWPVFMTLQIHWVKSRAVNITGWDASCQKFYRTPVQVRGNCCGQAIPSQMPPKVKALTCFIDHRINMKGSGLVAGDTDTQNMKLTISSTVAPLIRTGLCSPPSLLLQVNNRLFRHADVKD